MDAASMLLFWLVISFFFFLNNKQIIRGEPCTLGNWRREHYRSLYLVFWCLSILWALITPKLHLSTTQEERFFSARLNLNIQVNKDNNNNNSKQIHLSCYSNCPVQVKMSMQLTNLLIIMNPTQNRFGLSRVGSAVSASRAVEHVQHCPHSLAHVDILVNWLTLAFSF